MASVKAERILFRLRDLPKNSAEGRKVCITVPLNIVAVNVSRKKYKKNGKTYVKKSFDVIFQENLFYFRRFSPVNLD
jgi:hypothetical protein